MTVVDVFRIFTRGTVVLGRLEGNGRLSVGDRIVCQGRHWRVRGIEQHGAVIKTAEPGSSVGILLRKRPWGKVLRGMTLEFVPNGRLEQ
jgi:translation elongation factor EF-Tu-like GTPase